MFHPDGKHVLGGNDDGIWRWRLSDGQEVRKQTGTVVFAISVSRDQKWIVCGTQKGASVWDGEMQDRVVDVEGGKAVYAVDISPDSTRIATGTRNKEASIWSIRAGRRLVGPLAHDRHVTGIRFSPNGERIATAGNSIRIFDSHTGDILVTINDVIDTHPWVCTPLAWSCDGQQIIAAPSDNKIGAFDASTGVQLTESQILYHGVHSIALPANGKFVATFADRSISFLDAATLACIGPVIEDGKRIRSVAISPDGAHLATGQWDGTIIIRDLVNILPDLYGPFNASICAFTLRSISHVDKIRRYPLANKLLGNPVELCPRDTVTAIMMISSGYHLNLFSPRSKFS